MDFCSTFIDTFRKFLTSRSTNEYLQKRLNEPKACDPVFWKDLCELGIFEFIADSLDDVSISDAFCLLLELQVECGTVCLPEVLIESVFTGPFFLKRLLLQKEQEKVSAFFGESDYAALLAGKKVLG
ncbi:MAG: hypothetical protein KDD60_10060, partial [Bdellovibrionales bacterium]|nr:hypothetical protein [Bdellovibrionales bacterium]